MIDTPEVVNNALLLTNRRQKPMVILQNFFTDPAKISANRIANREAALL